MPPLALFYFISSSSDLNRYKRIFVRPYKLDSELFEPVHEADFKFVRPEVLSSDQDGGIFGPEQPQEPDDERRAGQDLQRPGDRWTPIL